MGKHKSTTRNETITWILAFALLIAFIIVMWASFHNEKDDNVQQDEQKLVKTIFYTEHYEVISLETSEIEFPAYTEVKRHYFRVIADDSSFAFVSKTHFDSLIPGNKTKLNWKTN